jgi:WD40 repeat protein
VRFVGLTNKALVASADHSLRLYDSAGTGGSERTFSGPRDFVYALAVSGDGKTVVAGGQDSVLWQWNAENAQLAQKFDPPAIEPATQK